MASPERIVERHREAGSEHGRALWHRLAEIVAFVHHFRVSSIDEQFSGWIRDAFEQVGCGRR